MTTPPTSSQAGEPSPIDALGTPRPDLSPATEAGPPEGPCAVQPEASQPQPACDPSLPPTTACTPPGAPQEATAPPPGGYRPPPVGPPPFQPQYAPPPGAPRRRSRGTVTCIIVLVVMIAVVLVGLTLLAVAVGSTTRPRATWSGLTGEAVGVITIEGLITSGGQISPFFGATSGSERISALFRQAAKDDSVKAIVLRINSPGGSAAASQEIYQAVEQYREKTKRPVVASMADVAASGGYYVAAPCDKIVALPATLTGSIGVLMETIEYHELLKKIGVKGNTITSAPLKDMGSPFRAMTDQERALFKAMLQDVHDQFVSAVAKGRRIDKARAQKLADGRVYTGRQAKKVGLIDELGTFRDAVQIAAQMAGIKKEPTVRFFGRMTMFEALFGEVESRAIRTFPPGLLFDPRLWPAQNLLLSDTQGIRME